MKVLILNGPNLNMLGKRPKEHYGSMTLEDINNLINKENNNHFDLEFYQSNYEGDLVTKIQESLNYAAIIINPAAYTHTSVALLDALKSVGISTVEVHISDVSKREDFRQISYVREYCIATVAGLGFNGYLKAIDILMENKNDSNS